MAATPFDPTAYYRFSNSATGADLTLSMGMTGYSSGLINSYPPPIKMTPLGAYSSENWQLFLDDDSGIYFIRNYDYKAKYQLGIPNYDRSVPSLLSSSASLAMQWNISSWEDGTGTWALRNGLLGTVPLFGVSVDAKYGNIAPAMNPNQDDVHWTIDINIGAGRISGPMLETFPSIEVRFPVFHLASYCVSMS
jgi:hypothetical protein